MAGAAIVVSIDAETTAAAKTLFTLLNLVLLPSAPL
jgi:hypothetical protein